MRNLCHPSLNRTVTNSCSSKIFDHKKCLFSHTRVWSTFHVSNLKLGLVMSEWGMSYSESIFWVFLKFNFGRLRSCWIFYFRFALIFQLIFNLYPLFCVVRVCVISVHNVFSVLFCFYFVIILMYLKSVGGRCLSMHT